MEWLREHGPSIAKAHLRRGQALHRLRSYDEAQRALELCAHCDSDLGLNMVMREAGVAAEARKELRLLRESRAKHPPREKRPRRRVVAS